MGYNPEVIAKYVHDKIMKQYALDIMPDEVAEAHKAGMIHCLSPNNDLIVMIDGIVQIMNIVEVVDSFDDMDIYVPSVNTESNIVEWKKVINGSCTGFKPVVEVTFAEGRKIEVTYDHKFIKINTDHKIAENYDYTINDFKNGLTSGICLINEIPYDNNDFYYESAFYGFFLGDGAFNNSETIQFNLVEEDKIDYIVDLADKLGLNPCVKKYDTVTRVSVDNPLLFKDKYSLPSFKLNYKGLLEGLINSGGYVTQHGGKKNNYLGFDSTNKFIFNLYVVACLSVGINPSVNIIPEKGNHKNLYRCLSHGLLTNKLLFGINLRDNHKIVEGSFNKTMHQLTRGTIKSIKDLGDMPVFNITVEDNHNFMAGTLGFIPVQNCHDLEYYALRPNCFNIDLRFFIKNGLIIDGKGVDGSVASPAKCLEVLLNHLLQALMAGAQVFSGGLGIANFNTFIAPLCNGRSYYDIKQAIQGFIFNCNMSLVSKGAQIIFSSVGLDMSVPEHLKDVPAVTFEGETIGTYKDYQHEADMVFKAFLEVLNEKDASGQWHRFPNTLINIQLGDLDEYNGTCKVLHELGANNPTLYYTNQSNYVKTIMGCRTCLPCNFTGVYDLDCLNTGNFAYTTLNLPLLALEANGNVDKFYELLNKYCDIARDGLLNRRELVKDVIYNKHMSDFLLQRDKVTGIPLYDIDRTTITLGFCGLYECMKILNYNFGENIIQFINNKTNEYKDKDGLRWSVIASPAESASHRFATIIKEKYPEAEVQGPGGSYYLTNSSHIPVNQESNIIPHIRNANKYHPLTKGGNILHIWLGETYHDPVAIWKLNKKILGTNTNFWAFTTSFTYCNDCHNTFNEALDTCSVCDSDDLTVYSRITGYYVPVKNWNNGKKAEFKDRYLQGGI